MYHLARMLRMNTGLISLNLSKNRIGDFGAKLLSEYLGNNTTLKILNLRWSVSVVELCPSILSRCVAHSAATPLRVWAAKLWRVCSCADRLLKS